MSICTWLCGSQPESKIKTIQDAVYQIILKHGYKFGMDSIDCAELFKDIAAVRDDRTLAERLQEIADEVAGMPVKVGEMWILPPGEKAKCTAI